ncbi:aminomethyltransferase, mitochondrial [Cylas formicarius]|uniref:aminomethyltransferase, mitochondrial n=1 Tax=Cylas formicarius TaxID=197179 RepID=UPI0029583B88|nr:aminomethyltransferase, mitochondrial [Cylas formicarius]
MPRFRLFLPKSAANSNVRRFCDTSKGETTPLYNFHVKNGGKIVNFGGFLLPVQYGDQSIVASHLFTRKSASLFDVSHMLQTEIKGKHCIECLESVCTADIRGLADNSGVLTVFTNDRGGILDDLIVTKISDERLYIVSNAAMRDQDRQILKSALVSYKTANKDAEVDVEFLRPSERALVALQGPEAARALQRIVDVDLEKLFFMKSVVGRVGDADDCRITRCGYTGEDGFEISAPAQKVQSLVRTLLDEETVKLAGLGARDSLRLEAGLCLYGNDITPETTPVEAALAWLVAKRRRELKNFPGAEVVLRQIKEGSEIKRVGLTLRNGPPARHGAEILTGEGEKVGRVTSGCPSPSLGMNIAMGYLPIAFSKPGTKIGVKIRDKVYEGAVTKMPFVPSNYHNKPK